MSLQARWFELLAAALAETGVRHVFLSPGSRSTPLALAFSAEPRLTVTSVIDERVAAFAALGAGKRSGVPAVFVCTSGSALGHALPAVIEAEAASAPLIVLSADRSFEHRDCGASQTIDQLKFFGDRVRFFAELPLAEAFLPSFAALRRLIVRAVFAAQSPRPGPVHLNLPARKPLEPSREPDPPALSALLTELRQRPQLVATPPRQLPDPAAIERAARAIVNGPSGLVVAGAATRAADPDRVAAFVARSGYVVSFDAVSQLRFSGRDFPALDRFGTWSALLETPRLDVVVQLGGAPTALGFETFLRRAKPAHWVVDPHVLADPYATATEWLAADLDATLDALTAALPPGLGETRRAERAAWLELERRAAAAIGSPPPDSEAERVRALLERLPTGSRLVIGNSLPVRELDEVSTHQGRRLSVLSQRGAAGIDGLVAGAAGAALDGVPTTLLLGDVSLLHDLGGLALAATLKTPLVIVVLNNDGGRIFERLPVAKSAPESLALFTTPHGRSFGAAAELWQLPFHTVRRALELDSALDAAFARPGASLIEVLVDPASARQEAERLADGLSTLLRETK